MRPLIRAMALVLIAGCGPGPDAPDPSALLVKGPSGSSVRLTDLEEAAGEVDDIEFTVKDQEFSIRGRSYGAVKLGDIVVIDANGDVRVGGDRRLPRDPAMP
jgi:hypothetical protein